MDLVELLREAQEQLRRMSVAYLAKLQQTVLSDADLLLTKVEVESMTIHLNGLSPDDVSRAVRALSQAMSPEDNRAALAMAARATAEELAAAMNHDHDHDHAHAHADGGEAAEAPTTPCSALEALAAACEARELKEQGDRLRRRGQFAAAAFKYEIARDSILLTRSPPTVFPAASAAVREECALSLMSCYLRTWRFDECVDEGSAVLERDPGNVTAYCRRGRAYRAMGRLEEAIDDLRRARVMCPEDETIAKDFGEVKEEFKLANDATRSRRRKGSVAVVEDIVDDEHVRKSMADDDVCVVGVPGGTEMGGTEIQHQQ